MEKSNKTLKNYLSNIYVKYAKGIYLSGNSGYWSNLTRESNKQFNKILESNDCKTAVRKFMPRFEEMIFSPKREAALELFDHNNKVFV